MGHREPGPDCCGPSVTRGSGFCWELKERESSPYKCRSLTPAVGRDSSRLKTITFSVRTWSVGRALCSARTEMPAQFVVLFALISAAPLVAATTVTRTHGSRASSPGWGPAPADSLILIETAPPYIPCPSGPRAAGARAQRNTHQSHGHHRHDTRDL